MAKQITFNDMPLAMAQFDDLLTNVLVLLTDMNQVLRGLLVDNHTPMDINEACAFLRMKKSTMYYHLRLNKIPATKKGKNYIFFKDELIKWAESGRVKSHRK